MTFSVRKLGGARADRPIEPYWKMLEQVQGAVEELPHQRLHGVSTGEWGEITESSNFFVTKLHGNIKPETACERPVPDKAADLEANAPGYRVLSDQYVRLGNDRTDRDGEDPDRWYRVLTVEVSTEEEIQILTNLL